MKSLVGSFNAYDFWPICFFLFYLLLLKYIISQMEKGRYARASFKWHGNPQQRIRFIFLRKTSSFKRHYYFRAVVFLEWTRLINFSFYLQRNVLVWHFTSGWLDLYKSWKKGHTSSYQKELFYFSFHLLFYYGRNNDLQEKKWEESPTYLCKLVLYFLEKYVGGSFYT